MAEVVHRGHTKTAPVTATRAVDWDRLAIVAAVMVGAIYGLAAVRGIVPPPGDAAVYWANTPGEYAVGVYIYPPALSQLLEPLRWIDAWEVFTVGWMALCWGSLGYVFGRWTWVVVLAAVPSIVLGLHDLPWAGPVEAVAHGNVTPIMLAGIVAGLRHPAWFGVPLLTKLTAGIGILWYPFRGEWRRFAVGLAVIGAVVLPLVLVNPDAWTGYVRFVLASTGATSNGPPLWGPPLAVRLPVTVLLIAWGARTNRPWLVPIACAVGLIGLYGWSTFGSVAMGAVSPRCSARPR